ncbi:expressed protein [Chlorella variabilis]|uniref:Expressed protein n=1 Tax=Chlorella variabilis TaxID=554065 RepID=E1ZG41_CHLVA|nr:expressed protein [Chlorella variabilis]EFN55397.1 expressed protein [Chlorella variabilis]|eukprot:XP_005847499.1 expressed protein [Chlorella variabilis]
MEQEEGSQQHAAAAAEDASGRFGIRFAGGQWVTSGHSQQLAMPQMQHVPEFGVTIPANPFLERADTMEAFSKSATLDPSPTTGQLAAPAEKEKERQHSAWRMSGIAIGDLFQITADPKVQKRVMKADSNNDGRISRKDILKVMQSEASAKHKLKWGLIIGGTLLVFCLLMLAANAALTYVVVSMSKDTSVQTSGVMTDKSGTTVVGTAQAAETADLLYAYHTPADAAASLLSLKQLLVTADSGTMSAYQVLSATLVAGKRLDFVVAAPTQDASGNGPVAEMIRIVISEEGVHEVRSGSIEQASGGGRRLLVTPSNSKASVTGLVTNTATSTCSATSGGTCSKAATQMSCPPVPVCGMDGKYYATRCLAAKAGTTVKCMSCGTNCAAPNPRPAGMPDNLSSYDGPNYVRTSPPPPAGGSAAATAAGGLARPGGLPANLGSHGQDYVRTRPPPPSPTAKNTKPASVKKPK